MKLENFLENNEVNITEFIHQSQIIDMKLLGIFKDTKEIIIIYSSISNNQRKIRNFQENTEERIIDSSSLT
jgi:hypothetical protein